MELIKELKYLIFKQSYYYIRNTTFKQYYQKIKNQIFSQMKEPTTNITLKNFFLIKQKSVIYILVLYVIFVIFHIGFLPIWNFLNLN